ncbi:hypothetical protein LDENG_00082080 [Lucifuga dentata]|nr:hypothetical protein LDENG_00242650 [Lucifuga dentata]KAF7653488.1 hypothetical protein LDENG_00082080 [Lucifuga dentata]
MDGAKYRETLEKNLMKSAERLKMGLKFIFQQDNDPRTRASMEWLQRTRWMFWSG